MSVILQEGVFKKVTLVAYAAAKKITASHEIARYLRATKHKKLNVGAQTNQIAGWLNADILPFPGVIYMDATKIWPFPDNTFEAILCEHMIDRIPKADAELLLDEAFRVMAPGMPIRLVTPNMLSFARIALNPGCEESATYLQFLRKRQPDATAYDAVNMIYYGHGHMHVYAPDELAAMLRRSGFTEVKETRAGTPGDPVFEKAEGHAQLLGEEANAVEAFAMEARKPSARPRPINS